MFFLVRYSEDSAEPIKVGDGHEVIVGRDPDKCRVVVLDPHVSRVHCSISVMGGQGWVEDLGSASGTYVNGERVDTALLSEGDVVRIGLNGHCTVHAGVKSADEVPTAAERPRQAAWPGG